MLKFYSPNVPIFALKVMIVLILSLLLTPTVSYAQDKLKFTIAEFETDPFDLSARSSDTEKYDGNGERYAIIKVTSTNPDDKLNEYYFNFGNMNHRIEEYDGVLWIYVQRNAKLVTITRDGYTPIIKYDLGTTIESGNNYVMTLSSESKKVYPQMVQFNIKPANSKAVVMVKNSMPDSQETLFGYADASGSVAKALPLGTYTYKVLADKYYTIEGRFTLNDRLETLTETIELKSKFSNMTFIVDADADIYINGEMKGTRKWTGQLNAGSYQVDCVEPNHTSTSQTVEVVENDNRTIQLAAPIPILGMVSITSSPLGANIKIDNKNYGQTPKNIELLTGNHVVELSKSGYYPENGSFVVNEDEPAEINFSLIEKSNNRSDYSSNGKKDRYYTENDKTTKTDDNRLVKPTDFYADLRVGYDFSTKYFDPCAIIGFAIGGHYRRFNLELSCTWPINSYQSYASGIYSEDELLKRVFQGNIKLGYAFLIGRRFKLTPQIGFGITDVKCKAYGFGESKFRLLIGVRTFYAFSNKFGICLLPEYDLNGEYGGFNIKLGFSFCIGSSNGSSKKVIRKKSGYNNFSV